MEFKIEDIKPKRINSRRKGKQGELEFRDVLRSHGFEAERGQQRSGSKDSPDVKHNISMPIHFEVKRTQSLNIHAAMAQAKRDCGTKTPVVAHKRNYDDWMVTIPANEFLNMVKKLEGL